MKFLHFNTKRNQFGVFSTNTVRFDGWVLLHERPVADKIINGFIWQHLDNGKPVTTDVDELKQLVSLYVD